MRIGTQTNSFINHIYARRTIGQPNPTVGMGAVVLMWTDREAATITEVTEMGGSKKFDFEIAVIRDREEVVKGSAQDGSAEFGYAPGRGPAIYFRRLRTNGQWVQRTADDEGKYGYRKGQGNGLRVGERDSYRDPSF
jgi:hypothetical protein